MKWKGDGAKRPAQPASKPASQQASKHIVCEWGPAAGGEALRIRPSPKGRVETCVQNRSTAVELVLQAPAPFRQPPPKPG